MRAGRVAWRYHSCVRIGVLGLALALAVSACSTTMTGRRQLTLINDDKMDAMGTATFSSLKAEGKLSQDPGVNEYVICVARAILEVIPAEYQPDDGRWEVLVFEDNTPNAFALPGGAEGKGWLIFDGVITVTLGVLIFMGFPFAGTVAIGVFLGIKLLFIGISMMLLGSAAKAVI